MRIIGLMLIIKYVLCHLNIDGEVERNGDNSFA